MVENVVPLRGGPPASDGWETEGGGYSPYAYYTASTDGHGQRAWMKVSVPPSVVAEIAALIEQRTIPEYRTAADVVRDALMHRLHWIEELKHSGQLRKVLTVQRLNSKVQRLEAEIDALEQFRDHVGKVLKAAAANNDRETLEHVIAEYDTDVEVLREPYRSEVRGLFATYRGLVEERGDG